MRDQTADAANMTVAFERNGRRIELAAGDITNEPTDAIVNAANSSLMGGGGVDGAIHRAAGLALLEACKAIIAREGRLETGRAVMTPGGNLRARYVIHTVGPVYQDGEHGEAALLASCYRESIACADRAALKTIAFPSISTGAYRYPMKEAARVALAAVKEALAGAEHLELVRFILFGEEARAIYEGAATELFAR